MNAHPLLLCMCIALTAVASRLDATTFAAQCSAAKCHCSVDVEGRLSATCYPSTDKFPTGLPAELSNLYIHCNSLKDGQGRPIIEMNVLHRIPEKALHGLTNLEDIIIAGCPISEFPSLLFANLTKLRHLSLESLLLLRLGGTLLWGSDNLESLQIINMADLEKIDPVLLYNQKRLSTVALKRMNISGEQVAAMIKPLRGSLSYFTWSNNLQPVNLPASIFKGFRRLNKVDLRNNQLSSLEFLIHTKTLSLVLEKNPHLATTPPFDFTRCRLLRNLIELDMRATNLRHVGIEFSAFRQLRKLYLGDNFLTSVPSVILTHLNRTLERLDLSNNRIQTFPSEMRKLFVRPSFELILDRNHLHCNCEARWLLSFPTFLRGVKCVSVPAGKYDIKERLLMVLSPAQLVCSAPSGPRIEVKNAVTTRSNFYGIRASALAANPADEAIINYEPGKPIPISRGQSLVLRCDSSGEPAPQLAWIFPWKAKLKRRADPERTLTRNTIEARIQHSHLRHFKEAKFTCQASNLVGTRESFVVLKNIHPIEDNSKELKPTGTVTAQPSKRDPSTAATLSRASFIQLFLQALSLSLLLVNIF